MLPLSGLAVLARYQSSWHYHMCQRNTQLEHAASQWTRNLDHVLRQLV